MGERVILKQFFVSLDLKRSTSNRPFEVVEGDTGNQIVITLTDDGVAVDCTGMLVAAIFSSSKGTAVQDSCFLNSGINIDGNQITINLFPNSIAPGMVECELQLYSSMLITPIKREDYDVLATSAKFNFSCRRAILNDDTIETFPELPLLTALANDIADADAARELAEHERESAEYERELAERGRESAEEVRQTAYDLMLASVGESGVIYLTGNGTPNAQTNGALGQLYLDIIKKRAYICIAKNAITGEHEWKRVFLNGDDGSQIAIERDESVYNFSDIPQNVTLGELLGRLGAWYYNIAGKQTALTFDLTPIPSSYNPVTSGGVYNACHINDWITIANYTLPSNAGIVECNAFQAGGPFRFSELRITIIGNLIGENYCNLYVNSIRERSISISSFMVSSGGSSLEAIAQLHLQKPINGLVQLTHTRGGSPVGQIPQVVLFPTRYSAISYGKTNGVFNVSSYNGIRLLFDVENTGEVYMRAGSRILVEGRHFA